MNLQVYRYGRGYLGRCRTNECRWDTLHPRDLISMVLDELAAHTQQLHPSFEKARRLPPRGVAKLPVLPAPMPEIWDAPLEPRLQHAHRLREMTAHRVYDPMLNEAGAYVYADVVAMADEIRWLRARLAEAREMRLFDTA